MWELLQINHEWLFTLGSFVSGGALGSLISTVANLKDDRRIKKSEAMRSEATAKREDASAATEMMGLLERTVAHMEKMNAYNESNSKSLLSIVQDKDAQNSKLKKDVELLQLQRAEDHRRITGLERTVQRELTWRKESDYHYCRMTECEVRMPPLGTLKRELK